MGILLIAIALSFHPYPWILGDRDPGVYVNTGVNIANTGGILIHDPILAHMDAFTQQFFYQIATPSDIEKYNLKYQGIQFPGFYITNKQTGEITPQFFYCGRYGLQFFIPYLAWKVHYMSLLFLQYSLS